MATLHLPDLSRDARSRRLHPLIYNRYENTSGFNSLRTAINCTQLSVLNRGVSWVKLRESRTQVFVLSVLVALGPGFFDISNVSKDTHHFAIARMSYLSMSVCCMFAPEWVGSVGTQTCIILSETLFVMNNFIMLSGHSGTILQIIAAVGVGFSRAILCVAALGQLLAISTKEDVLLHLAILVVTSSMLKGAVSLSKVIFFFNVEFYRGTGGKGNETMSFVVYWTTYALRIFGIICFFALSVPMNEITRSNGKLMKIDHWEVFSELYRARYGFTDKMNEEDLGGEQVSMLENGTGMDLQLLPALSSSDDATESTPGEFVLRAYSNPGPSLEMSSRGGIDVTRIITTPEPETKRIYWLSRRLLVLCDVRRLGTVAYFQLRPVGMALICLSSMALIICCASSNALGMNIFLNTRSLMMGEYIWCCGNVVGAAIPIFVSTCFGPTCRLVLIGTQAVTKGIVWVLHIIILTQCNSRVDVDDGIRDYSFMHGGANLAMSWFPDVCSQFPEIPNCVDGCDFLDKCRVVVSRNRTSFHHDTDSRYVCDATFPRCASGAERAYCELDFGYLWPAKVCSLAFYGFVDGDHVQVQKDEPIEFCQMVNDMPENHIPPAVSVLDLDRYKMGYAEEWAENSEPFFIRGHDPDLQLSTDDGTLEDYCNTNTLNVCWWERGRCTPNRYKNETVKTLQNMERKCLEMVLPFRAQSWGPFLTLFLGGVDASLSIIVGLWIISLRTNRVAMPCRMEIAWWKAAQGITRFLILTGFSRATTLGATLVIFSGTVFTVALKLAYRPNAIVKSMMSSESESNVTPAAVQP